MADPAAVNADLRVRIFYIPRNSPRPQVGTLAHLCVTDIGQMRYLGTHSDLRILHLHKGTNLGTVRQFGPGTQGSIRPDHCSRTYRNLPEYGIPNLGVRSDPTVTDKAIGSQLGTTRHGGVALQMHSRTDPHPRL